jgi:hypothetical protein
MPKGSKAKGKAKAPRGRRATKRLPSPPKSDNEEDVSMVPPPDRDDHDLESVASRAEGEGEIEGDIEGDTESQASEPVAGGRKKKSKKSCHLKDEDQEAAVLEWVEANPMLWNQKDKEFKNKSKKDRMWEEKGQQLGYEGKFAFISIIRFGNLSVLNL